MTKAAHSPLTHCCCCCCCCCCCPSSTFSSSSSSSSSSGGSFCSDRLLAVQCESQEEMERWVEEIQEVITMSKYGTVKDPAILSKRLQRKEQEKNARLNKDLGNSNNQSSKGKTREYGSSSHDSKDDDRSSSPRRPIIMPTKEDKDKEAAQQKGLPSSSGVKGGKEGKGRKEGKETASVDLKDPVFRGQLKEAAHVFFQKADKDGKVKAACLSLFSIWTQNSLFLAFVVVVVFSFCFRRWIHITLGIC